MSQPPNDSALAHRVENQLVRTSEFFARLDRNPVARAASRRVRSRGVASAAQRLTNVGMALAVLIVGTIVAGLVMDGIGMTGLFIVAALMLLAVLLFGFWGGEEPVVEYKETMSNQAVVQRLDGLLVRKRAALPVPAATRIDAISRQLPLLENRLAEADILDPLAQDARRLMGKHLPELIERYERVPPAYRHERDGEGMTVDERLVAGLDAANRALDDLGRRLAHEDMTAFESKGRFIESRYREDGSIRGE